MGQEIITDISTFLVFLDARNLSYTPAQRVHDQAAAWKAQEDNQIECLGLLLSPILENGPH